MNGKELKVGLIWANPYNLNLGVAALAYSAIAMIFDAAKRNGQKISLTVIGSNQTVDDSINVLGNTYSYSNVKGLDYFELKSLLKVLLRYNNYKIHRLKSFDIIFDVGEGDSFSDIYGVKRFNRINNSKKLFNWLGVKQVLLPQTIGPFYSKTIEKEAQRAITKDVTVIARDKKSKDCAELVFQDHQISESIDLAFYLPFEKKYFEEGSINIGLNVSGLLWKGGYTQNNQFKLKTDYRKCIHEIISYFLSVPNVKLFIVPHVVSTKLGSEGDVSTCKEISSQYNVELAPIFSSPIEAKSFISGLDFFVGARMHSCIAAFSSGVPVIPMAYSRKFEGLFSDTLEYDYLCDCMNDETDVSVKKIISGFEKRDLLENKVTNSLSNIVKPRVEQLLETVGGFFKELCHP